MPGRVRVLGAKGGAEGVNVGQRAGERLGFKLAADRQVSRPREKILRVIDRAILASRGIFQVERSNAEQFPCPFAIAPGDDRRVNVNKAAFLEKLVNRK